MGRRLIPLALVAALLLSLAAVAAACGGDDDDGGGNGGGNGGAELTLEEYFQELQDLAVEFDERGTEVGDKFDDPSVETDEDAINATRDFLDGSLVVLTDFVDGLEGLNPPAEVQEEHDAAVTAGQAMVTLFEGLVEDAADAESAADLESLFEPLMNEEAFSAACIDLQAAADEAGIHIDLRCG